MHQFNLLPNHRSAPLNPILNRQIINSINKHLINRNVQQPRLSMPSLERKAPLNSISMQDSVETAREALTKSDALLVTSDGKPAAVVTRHDLLAFLST